jgi:hypothetical protein
MATKLFKLFKSESSGPSLYNYKNVYNYISLIGINRHISFILPGINL